MLAVSYTLDEVLDGTGIADVDLNDVCRGDGTLFVRDGLGIAGHGVAATLPLDHARDVLASIEHHDTVGGAHLRAIGAVPFVPDSDATVVVPRLSVAKASAQRRWVTVVDDGLGGTTPSVADVRRQVLERVGQPRPAARAETFHVTPLTPVERYLDAVATARDAVRRGDIAKAVIARQVAVTSEAPVDLHAVLLRLKAAFSTSYRYSIDGLIGASPELLVSVDDGLVRSRPLAGTAPRSGDPATDEAAAAALLDSVKDQIEHRVVIDMIHDTLLPWCSYLDWEPQPSIVTVANVQHLATLLEGRLSEPRPSVVTLVRALSPTPALGGSPRLESLRLIADVEGFDRGRYGGAVGWLDGSGEGEWAVTIRCAEFSPDRRRAVLCAGGGIVAGSEPVAELAETQAKLQAMLSAIVRP